MALLKKIKHLKTLFKKPSTKSDQEHYAHLSPISDRIQNWLDDRQWTYEHLLPDEDDELRSHYFAMGFQSDDDFSWHCLICVHERTQLISFQGSPNVTVDKKHYLQLINQFNLINNSISIGSLELDVKSGHIRTKIGIDGEFSILSNTALDSYLRGLASLTEKAHDLTSLLIKDPNPSQDLLKTLQEQGLFEDETETDTSGNAYFVPTHKAQ